MKKERRKIFMQVIGLLAFCLMAIASASSKDISRDIDWRGAAVGGAAGYNGFMFIGTANSESEARSLAEDKGYTAYVWDSVNGKVYAK